MLVNFRLIMCEAQNATVVLSVSVRSMFPGMNPSPNAETNRFRKSPMPHVPSSSPTSSSSALASPA